MAELTLPQETLIERAHGYLNDVIPQRKPIALAALTSGVAIALGAGMLIVEWHTFSLVLGELFPTVSNAESDADKVGILAFASIGAILMGDVLLEKASEHFSRRTERWLNWAGLGALGLFAIGAMALLPASMWQSGEVAASTTGETVSQGAYAALSVMLGALFPVSLLSNFVLIRVIKNGLKRLEQARMVDGLIRRVRGLIAAVESSRSALRQCETQRPAAPDDDVATRCAAIIGNVASEIKSLILRRMVVDKGGDTLAASETALANVMPLEALQAQFDYLTTFTPQCVRAILDKRGD